eukprot:Gb_11049 [translate_table: standard]
MKISLMSLLSVWLFWSLMIMQLSVAQDIQQQFLSPHNDARSAVGVGPLQWDDTVAAYAQNYANQRSGDCAMIHSGGQYGENLFAGSGKDYTPADAVVWKNSVKLGCARVVCGNGGNFITCNYDPPGNYVGQKPY